MKKLTLFLLSLIFIINVSYSQWKKLNEPLWGGHLTGLAVKDNNAYAVFRTGKGQFFQSDDLGENWKKISSWKEYGSQSLHLSDNKFYIFSNGGFFASSDSGNTWEEILLPENHQIISYCISNDNIYATFKKGNEIINGIHLTSDFGKNWKMVYDNKNLALFSLLAYEENVFTQINFDLYFSNDNGNSWKGIKYDSTVKELQYLKILKIKDSIYLATPKGIYFTSDYGNTWNNLNNGLTDNYISDLIYSDNKLFAVTYLGGVFESNDNGNSWKSVTNNLGSLRNIQFCSKDNNYFVGTYEGAIYKSEDYGNNWKMLSRGSELGMPYATAVLSNSGEIFASFANCGVHYTNNNGETWKMLNDDLKNYYVGAIEADGSDIYACTSKGLFKSIDRGKSWIIFGFEGQWVNRINVVDSTMYVVAGSKLYISLDKGTNWYLGSEFTNVNTIALSDTRIYIGTLGDGIYFSADSGNTWTDASIGLTNTNITVIAVDSNYVFAGTLAGIFMSSDFGENWALTCSNDNPVTIKVFKKNIISVGANVYISTNHGKSWKTYNKGLEGTLSDHRSFCIDENKLYVCSNDWIYKAGFDELIMTGVEEEVVIENDFEIIPNPASDFIEIALGEQPALPEQIRIYDVFGREVNLTQSQDYPTPALPAGEGVKIDVSLLPPGVYFVRVGGRVGKFVKL